jgi:hypothetical protein
VQFPYKKHGSVYNLSGFQAKALLRFMALQQSALHNSIAQHKPAASLLPHSSTQLVKEKHTLPVASLYWEKKAQKVYVVGNFTYPQWTVKIPMKWSSRKGIHQAFIDGIKEGSLFKFVVDGEYECSEIYDMSIDERGTCNNAFHFPKCSKKSFNCCTGDIIRDITTQSKIRRLDSQPCLTFNLKRWLSM